MSKFCPKCSEDKPHEEFDKNSARHDGLHSWCKSCRVKGSRDSHIFNKYGLTAEEYDKMLEAQDGVCYICSKEETRKNRSGATSLLSVDHNHVTGQVRALLCDDCNNGIGRFHEDVSILLKAVSYLNEFEGGDK